MVSSGIQPGYFLDEMSFEEISALIKADDNKRREEWEKTRYQCFYSVISYSDKIKTPQELFTLPWDKQEKKVSKISPDKAKDKASKLEARLNKR